jgi:hypothetical protein
MSVIVEPGRTFLDNSGRVLNAGTVTFYVAGSVFTKKAIYPTAADQAAGTNALSNPQTLNSAGRLQQQVHGSNSYRMIVKDSLGGTILDEDILVPQEYLEATASQLGGILYPRTSAEITAGVTPANYAYPAEPIADIRRYGAVDLTGSATCSSIVQLAIDAHKASGGTIYFPPGTYKFATTVNWISTVNSGLPGIYFIGEAGTGGPNGPQTTCFKSYIASGPMFQIQGTKTQASGGTGSLFINGGGFSDICFDGSNATGTSQAIRVNGWQYAENRNCTIQNFPGDGVTQYTDAGYANGDYSSSSINWTNCWFWSNAGIGVNQTGYVGAWSWRFEKCLWGYNSDGVVVTSAGNSFLDCSWVGDGYTQGGTPRSGGWHIKAGVSTGSINRLYLRGCEFDFARLGHISLDYISAVLMQGGRMIFNDRFATGALTPPLGVSIAPAGAGSNVTGSVFDHVNIRIDTPGTLSAFKIHNISNVADIQVNDAVVSDNVAGSATLTGAPAGTTSGTLTANFTGATGTYLLTFSQLQTRVGVLTHGSTSVTWTGALTDTGTSVVYAANMTRYDGFTASNFNLRQHYVATEGGVTYVPGKPAPCYIGQTTSVQTIPTAAFQTILYDTQDSINAAIYPATATQLAASATSFYNTATGKFYCPCNGFYEVSADLQIVGTVAADTIRAAILYNGTTLERDILGTATSVGTTSYVIPTTTVYCPAGATIEVQARSPINARNLSVAATIPSRLTIRLV